MEWPKSVAGLDICVGVDGRFLVTVEASVGAGDSTRLRVCEEFGRMTNSLSCPANAGRWIADRYERTPAGLIGKYSTPCRGARALGGKRTTGGVHRRSVSLSCDIFTRQSPER
jgi:hypothetical protein